MRSGLLLLLGLLLLRPVVAGGEAPAARADAQLRASLNLWWHLGAQVKYHAALEMAIWHYVGIFGEQRCVPCQRHAA